MRRLFFALGAAALLTAAGPPVSRDSANQLARDRRYAHDAGGNILFGPSLINERVTGQRDSAGNVHVDSAITPRRAAACPPEGAPPTR